MIFSNPDNETPLKTSSPSRHHGSVLQLVN